MLDSAECGSFNRSGGQGDNSSVDIIPGLNKLLEIAASGIGAVAGPFLAPWKARREGQARTAEAAAEARVLEIQAEAHVRGRRIAPI